MSTAPVASNHDPPGPQDKPASHDDMSDVTANNKKNPTTNEQEMASKVLKFSFVYSGSTKHQIAPSTIHTHWMQAVQAALSTDIIIINNHNHHVKQISTIKWTDQTIHQKQFKLYQKTTGKDDKRNTTYYILHRILTNVTVSEIMALPTVKILMKEYQCYVTDHQWNETQWDTTRIGFVTNHDPSFFNRTQAAAKFNDLLYSKQTTKLKIPMFRFVFSSPQVRHPTHTVSTKAYAVEVLHEDTTQMLQVLQTTLRDTPIFVPYTLCRKYPDGYEKAIRYQTQGLTSSMVIILQNLTTDMMFYLQPRILKTHGVRDIIPSPKGRDTGRYSVLVEKTEFAKIRSTLNKAIPEWVLDIPSDAMPPTDQFPGPARVKPLYEDGISSGENSWMTQSNASFMSMELPPDTGTDYFRTSMNANKIFSYADVVITPSFFVPDQDQATQASISAVTGTNTEADTAQQTELNRLNELHAQAKAESTKIIEEQRLEIAQLKAQRIADMELHAKEVLSTKVQEQEDATTELRHKSVQTKREVSELRQEMQAMMQKLMEALSTKDATTEKNPRDTDNNSQNSEKRRDVRSTPGRKLVRKEMDLQDSTEHTTAMETDVATPPRLK